jgi:hypothetical protein
MHAYEVEIWKNGKREYVKVDARNRTSANAKVAKLGHKVMSVNMVG